MSNRWISGIGILALLALTGCGKVPERHYVINEAVDAPIEAAKARLLAAQQQLPAAKKASEEATASLELAETPDAREEAQQALEEVQRTLEQAKKTIEDAPAAIAEAIKERNDIAEFLTSVLEEHFGTPEAPKLKGTERVSQEWLNELVSQERLNEGSKLYRIHCQHCHGVSGDGTGPTAQFLFPKPRDYRLGVFKFTSTSTGAHPTEDDLRKTIDEGIPGTSMPSFKLLPEEQREALLDYLILLSMRGELELLLLEEAAFGVPDAGIVQESLDLVMSRWKLAPTQVVQPREPMPPYSDEQALSGRTLFLTTGAQCVGCHGRDFRGRGSQEMNPDAWGDTIRPADLTLGLYRGGRRPIDIYWRIANGIKGTPMPGYRNSLSDEQIWQLVHFVRALPYRKDFQKAPPIAETGETASVQ